MTRLVVLQPDNKVAIAGPSGQDLRKRPDTNEIETLLIIHEKKKNAAHLPGGSGFPGANSDSSSSDSEDEYTSKPKPTIAAGKEPMEWATCITI